MNLDNYIDNYISIIKYVSDMKPRQPKLTSVHDLTNIEFYILKFLDMERQRYLS